jgi:ribosomal protein S18 acetylase RimI-like enzyme
MDSTIIGLMDIEIENTPGELCLCTEERGGFPWEFSVHPDYWGQGIGTALLEHGRAELRRRGIRRMEFWSMDKRSQEWYERAGMTELERHYQFMFGPEKGDFAALRDVGIALRFAHATCSVEDWPRVQEELQVLYRAPMEPHLTIGYEDRF